TLATTTSSLAGNHTEFTSLKIPRNSHFASCSTITLSPLSTQFHSHDISPSDSSYEESLLPSVATYDHICFVLLSKADYLCEKSRGLVLGIIGRSGSAKTLAFQLFTRMNVKPSLRNRHHLRLLSVVRLLPRGGSGWRGRSCGAVMVAGFLRKHNGCGGADVVFVVLAVAGGDVGWWLRRWRHGCGVSLVVMVVVGAVAGGGVAVMVVFVGRRWFCGDNNRTERGHMLRQKP
ncbi:LOW QUALITY PROTEIN: hypothetical protein M8C21_010506, partial [Ambrosia artemisiifolia]